jgi:hypothetical protein
MAFCLPLLIFESSFLLSRFAPSFTCLAAGMGFVLRCAHLVHTCDLQVTHCASPPLSSTSASMLLPLLHRVPLHRP